jgi:FkbM family methyltransferase
MITNLKQLLKKSVLARRTPSLKQVSQRESESASETFPSHEASLKVLRNLGWNPVSCIDIGAYKGEWTRMFHSIFPGSSVLMIEPQDAKMQVLSDYCKTNPDKLLFAGELLGASDGDLVEFAEMETGSSVFEEDSPYKRFLVEKRLITLDSLMKRFPRIGSPRMLKIDTQGYELEILKGAESVIRTIDVLLLEVSLVRTNRGAPLFADIFDYLTKNKFTLFDFCSQIRRKDGVLWQTDLMWIRDGCGIVIPTKLDARNWFDPADVDKAFDHERSLARGENQ